MQSTKLTLEVQSYELADELDDFEDMDEDEDDDEDDESGPPQKKART